MSDDKLRDTAPEDLSSLDSLEYAIMCLPGVIAQVDMSEAADRGFNMVLKRATAYIETHDDKRDVNHELMNQYFALDDTEELIRGLRDILNATEPGTKLFARLEKTIRKMEGLNQYYPKPVKKVDS